MKIAVLGTGYVGLVSGTCFAEIGAMVTCADIDETKINSLNNGEIPIFEPGLSEIVKNNVKKGNLKFSANIEATISESNVIFIAVGTPQNEDGSAKLDYIFKAAETIAKKAKNGVIIVTKSTVPVGTNAKISEVIHQMSPDLDFSVVSNPEFLREGSAIKDFMEPDRVVIGSDNKNSAEIIAKLYSPLNAKILLTSLETAEMAKYTANSMLALRICFINEMADVCEKIGANIEEVAEAIGLDERIGSQFLKTGPGYGGSCFPKDTAALNQTAESTNSPSLILRAAITSNNLRKVDMAKKIVKAVGGSVKGKTIGILGLSFKANTDDIRDSSSLVIIEELYKQGANIIAHDVEAIKNAKNYFEKRDINIQYAVSITEVTNCDAIAIITEWDEYKNLQNLEGKTLIDMRNLYNPKKMLEMGVNYYSLGR